MDFAQLMGASCVIKDALGRSGLTGIDMCGDADIPHPLEWYRSGHKKLGESGARSQKLECLCRRSSLFSLQIISNPEFN
jgi:hypothetical protein